MENDWALRKKERPVNLTFTQEDCGTLLLYTLLLIIDFNVKQEIYNMFDSSKFSLLNLAYEGLITQQKYPTCTCVLH